MPDPNFPFLGVHYTRMIGGGVECGPNAVLALAREGYTWSDINIADLMEVLTYGGFLRMMAKHWAMASYEVWRSLNKAAFTKALQRLIPGIRETDLHPAPAGIRAQALTAEGTLVDDFLLQESPPRGERLQRSVAGGNRIAGNRQACCGNSGEAVLNRDTAS